MTDPQSLLQPGETLGTPVQSSLLQPGETLGTPVGSSTSEPPSAAGPHVDMQQVDPYTGKPSPNYIPQNASTSLTDFGNDKVGKFIGSAAETSGITGISQLVSARGAWQLHSYHQALEAVKRGDWKSAVNNAYAAISGTGKDDPLYDAAKKIIETPWEETQKAYQEAKKGNVGEAVVHGATAVPILGPGARAVGEKTAQDIKEGEWSKAAGDVAGFVSSLGFGKSLGETGEAGEAAETVEGAKPLVRPSTAEIAGEKVPVSTPQLQDQGALSKLVQKAGTREGAQKFINNEVQPAAAKATQANFSKAALADVENLQKLRGETPSEPPVLHTVDDISKHLKTSAQETYKKLDQAAEEDHALWEQEHKQWEEDTAKLGKGATPLEEPVEPKKFTELQDDINNASDTLNSKISSQVDKEAAKKSLPQLKKQMSDFLDKHPALVESGELAAANNVYRKGIQYDWIAKKMRSATTGTEGTASKLAQKPTTLNSSSLEKLPGQFDNKFGEGSFKKLMGNDGMKNYNDILNVLKNPMQAPKFNDWIKNSLTAALGYAAGGPAGAAGAVLSKIGTSSLADNLLFNPEFGQKAITAWKSVKGAAGKAVANRPVLKPTAGNVALQGARSIANVYSGAGSALGGSQ